MKRLPKIAKVGLVLLLPLSIFLIGALWNVPYAKQIAVIIFLALIALGGPSGEAADGDL